MSDVSLLTLVLTVAIGAAVFAFVYTQQNSKKGQRTTHLGPCTHTLSAARCLTASLTSRSLTSSPLSFSAADDRSSEMAELQKTVRLLIEKGMAGGNNAQTYAASAASPPIVTNLPSTQRGKKAAAAFNFTGQPATHSQSHSTVHTPSHLNLLNQLRSTHATSPQPFSHLLYCPRK